MPRLRFPEFSGEWVKVSLLEICERVTRKNKNNRSKLPLTISAQYGLVDQITFFNKVVASADMSNYYLLKKGEFAYNKSYSSDYPWGAIKRLDRYDEGALSSLYICFNIRKCTDSDFAVQYFESPKWYREVSNIAGEGARNHGLLNIAVGDFFNTKHYLPSSIDEQKKIAKLLLLLDQRIATQNKIIEDLKKLKVAICNKLIDNLVNREPLICFSEVYSKASEGGTPETSKSEYYENGIIPFIKIDDLSNKYITSNKDFITDLGLQKSSAWIIPTHSLIYSNGATIGAISINTYEVCTKQGILGIVPKSAISVEYLYCLMSSNYFSKQVHRIITHGTMATAYLKDINKIKVPIPCMPQQLEIANTVSSVTNKIETELNILSLLKKQKQYLLQQMFI